VDVCYTAVMVYRPILIAPSILSADLGRLQEEVASIEQAADWLQVDVMDGHFVPNLSFGAPVLKCIKTKLPLDIHLMVANPEERIEEFLQLKVKHITFHAETVPETDSRRALIQAIRDGKATAGIALKPDTPLEEIEDVVEDVDLVLIMSVEPGFGGQKFLPDVLAKVRTLRARFPKLMIQMDGGINDQTSVDCIAAGADNLVAGSFIFGAHDRAAAIASLKTV
jgi:ribulose-phosphate 3-epimerase